MLTKSGKVGDFFTLVSMKSPYIYQKTKFKSPCQSLEVNIHAFSSTFTYKEFPHSCNLTYTGLYIQYFFQTCWLHHFEDHCAARLYYKRWRESVVDNGQFSVVSNIVPTAIKRLTSGKLLKYLPL